MAWLALKGTLPGQISLNRSETHFAPSRAFVRDPRTPTLQGVYNRPNLAARDPLRPIAPHELGTNAAKYGALSSADGRVDLEWSVTTDAPRRFLFRWAETNGPPVKPPERRGFGSRLIERGLAQDLDADIRLEFISSGLVCTIASPLDAISGTLDARNL